MISWIKSMSYIKYLIFVILSILLYSCNLIDDPSETEDNSDLADPKEQALTTVVSIQDNASDIMYNLFSSGVDTLAVIDSLAKFFLSESDIQNVWADSEGVSVEYSNGISGGIFVGQFKQPIIEGSPPDSFMIELTDEDIHKNLHKYNSSTSNNKKSVFFDGGYTEFKKYDDPVINSANNSFAKVGIAPFVKYLDKDATLSALSTLSDFGFIHLTGHGWYRRKSSGFAADKVTYLLTGEVPDINKIDGDIWQDILDKKIIVVTHKNENRYWVSPKFISDRNSFHNKEVFVYNGICYGGRAAWRREMVTNAGASAFVGIKYQVEASWETEWAKEMYATMCDTEWDEPVTIIECLSDIVNGYHGYYSSSFYDNYWISVHLTMQGDRGYAFWEKELEIDWVYVYVWIEDPLGRIRKSWSYNGDWRDLEYRSLSFSHSCSNGSKINNVYSGVFNYDNPNGRKVRGDFQITFGDEYNDPINFHIDEIYTGSDTWEGAWRDLNITNNASNWTENTQLDCNGVRGGWDVTELYPNYKKVRKYELYDRTDSDINVVYTAHGDIINSEDNWDVEYVSHIYDGNPNHIEVLVFYK